MLVAAGFCPHPPLLVPEVAAGAGHELDDVRAACQTVLTDLLEVRPDLLVVVGAGDEPGEWRAGATGTFRPFGVELDVVLGAADTGDDQARLPLSLAVGAWLLRGRSSLPPLAGVAVAATLAPQAALQLGAGWGRRAPRVGMLVMGDGSACLTERAPGHVVPGAVDWQSTAGKALAAADLAAVSRLDPADADRFMALGRAPWQVAAGAALAAREAGRPVEGSLIARSAPYGVDYLVASWHVR